MSRFFDAFIVVSAVLFWLQIIFVSIVVITAVNKIDKVKKDED